MTVPPPSPAEDDIDDRIVNWDAKRLLRNDGDDTQHPNDIVLSAPNGNPDVKL